MIFSCSTRNSENYLIDKVVIVKSWCREPLDIKNDPGFANCPIIAVCIDNKLNYFSTKGSPETSKMDCYSGHITENTWDFIYKNYVTRVLKDSNNWDFNDYQKQLEKHTLYDLYTGPEYLIICFRNNRNIKTIQYRNPGYACEHNTFFNFMVVLQKKLTLNKMKDTCLIDLTQYTFMPPSRLDPEIKFSK